MKAGFFVTALLLSAVQVIAQRPSVYHLNNGRAIAGCPVYKEKNSNRVVITVSQFYANGRQLAYTTTNRVSLVFKVSDFTAEDAEKLSAVKLPPIDIKPLSVNSGVFFFSDIANRPGSFAEKVVGYVNKLNQDAAEYGVVLIPIKPDSWLEFDVGRYKKGGMALGGSDIYRFECRITDLLLGYQPPIQDAIRANYYMWRLENPEKAQMFDLRQAVAAAEDRAAAAEAAAQEAAAEARAALAAAEQSSRAAAAAEQAARNPPVVHRFGNTTIHLQ